MSLYNVILEAERKNNPLNTFSNFTVESKGKTPEIRCNIEDGTIYIGGNCIPEDAYSFFEPLNRWLDEYLDNPADRTVMTVDLHYFNTSSANILLHLFKKISSLKPMGKELLIEWIHEEDDEEIEEAGGDYAAIIGTHLVLKPKASFWMTQAS